MASYDIVIGMEAHAELLTQSKLWCTCPNKFGAEPNTEVCPICLGMPGVLPVLNRRAFALALKAAVALRCEINRKTFFDRKQYYYPDLPKNYQISQNYCNLGERGCLDIPFDGGTKPVRIWNVHLEEDAGKNVYAEFPGADYSMVDLNRAGVPLLEIVSAPDMSSIAEAESYMHTLRQILLYTEVSDCKMQEGTLRFEPSISLKPRGSDRDGVRVEIKNLNSVKAVLAALEHEIERQTDIIESGGHVKRDTRLWDEQRGVTESMRSKEEAHDYRYLPDPDLIPVHVTDAWLAEVTASLPELPIPRKKRFMDALGMSEYNAGVLTAERAIADYYEACLAAHDSPKTIANWVMNDVLRECNDRKIAVTQFAITPARLAQLVKIADAGRINTPTAREVFVKMIASGKDAEAIVKSEGLEQVGDASELEPIIRQVIADNPKPAEQFRAGKKKAAQALIGPIMRATRGKADPKVVSELIAQILSE